MSLYAKCMVCVCVCVERAQEPINNGAARFMSAYYIVCRKILSATERAKQKRPMNCDEVKRATMLPRVIVCDLYLFAKRVTTMCFIVRGVCGAVRWCKLICVCVCRVYFKRYFLYDMLAANWTNAGACKKPRICGDEKTLIL